jgi:hypothetical protein
MTGKLDGIAGINTSTVDNEFCQAMQKTDAVCRSCYSQAMLEGMRKNCRPAWKKNLELLSNDGLEKIPQITKRSARFHAHGELKNTQHAINFLLIAHKNKGTRFAFFTKRPRLVQNAVKVVGLPDNVTLVYSSPKIDKQAKLPKGFHKVFTVYSMDRDSITCAGQKCKDCLQCFNRSGPINVHEKLR